MQINDTTLVHLNRCTVAIQKAGSDNVLGTGVIVTDDGLILTCYHVVGNIKTKTLDKTVDIYFPEIKSIKPADIVEEYCTPSLDIAFLKLKEDQKLPDKIAIANLGETVSFGHKFASMGFRKSNMFEKLSSSGEIRIKTSYKTKDGVESLGLVQLYSDEIERGMSGAPILDVETNKVIGIISDHYHTEGNVDAKLNFAIPVEAILKLPKVASTLKEKNPGLKLIFEFLRKIGAEGIKKYEKIDELYVPPTNYHNIKESLYKDRILFLTGTQEYGKTYTAVYLLWEYFNKGYEPVWFKGAEEKEERKDVRSRFLNIEKYLKPHNIIYFEDPFGKTEYEVNVDEGIVRNIASIIETIENVYDDTYVIITSREEVFKEFEHKITGEVDLRKFEKKLSVKTPSYDYEKRKEMLLKHSIVMNSKWLEDKDLTNTILETIKDKTKLSTPLNIEQFAISTASKNVLQKDKILEKINAKSIETAKSFAEEIKTMSADKIVFLSFPFLNYFPVDFVKDKYQKLVKELHIEEQEDALEFARILDWFKDDKIDISYNKWKKNNVISFSHPSYSEAFRFAIWGNGHTTKAGKTFNNVLIKLAEKDAAWYADAAVAHVVSSYFDKLPENVRNDLLIKVGDYESAARDVANAIAINFDKLPENVRNELFIKLADSDDTVVLEDVVYTVCQNFDKLPENVRNSLLFKLAENRRAAYDVAKALAAIFDKLPENVRNELLLRLIDCKYSIFNLVDILKIINDDFEKIPESVRNELLLRVFDKTEKAVFYTVERHADDFEKIPESVRNEFWSTIMTTEGEPYYQILHLHADDFEKIPESVRNGLLITENSRERKGRYRSSIYYYRSETAYYLTETIANNFEKLPENVRNLLFKLADNKETAPYAYAAITFSDDMPESERNKLLEMVPESERNKLLEMANDLLEFYISK